MDNITFVDKENIQMVHQDEDYRTSDTSRLETSFMEPDATEPISTLRLKQKLRRDKIDALYRHLSVTGNLDFIDLIDLSLQKIQKKGITIFEFYNGDR